MDPVSCRTSECIPMFSGASGTNTERAYSLLTSRAEMQPEADASSLLVSSKLRMDLMVAGAAKTIGRIIRRYGINGINCTEEKQILCGLSL